MQKNNLKNIFAQALKPSRLSVMLNKVTRRLYDTPGSHSLSETKRWLISQCSSFEDFAMNHDTSLWEESKRVSVSLEEHARSVLQDIEYQLGGGGIYPLLYFITRYTKPNCILETGVAAGFSSSSFLTAIKKNNKGRLHSSDFPYFRLPNPEKFIGILVEESLKNNWDLYIEGDEINLPAILRKVNKIDVFHYDSDKSYSGRTKTLSLVRKHLNEDAILLIDDIQDNSFFYDYVANEKPESWYVFEFRGKYVGMIGKLKKA